MLIKDMNYDVDAFLSHSLKNFGKIKEFDCGLMVSNRVVGGDTQQSD